MLGNPGEGFGSKQTLGVVVDQRQAVTGQQALNLRLSTLPAQIDVWHLERINEVLSSMHSQLNHVKRSCCGH